MPGVDCNRTVRCQPLIVGFRQSAAWALAPVLQRKPWLTPIANIGSVLRVRWSGVAAIAISLSLVLVANQCPGQSEPGQSEPTLSEPTQPLAIDIANAAQMSAEQLDPDRIADIPVTELEFRAATENLRVHLSRTASAKNSKAWLDYLAVAPVFEAIDSKAREPEIAVKSKRVAERATGVHPGLETPAVVRLRSAARSYSNALRFHRKTRMTDALSKQLVRFSGQWSEIQGTPSPDEIATLRLLLDLLGRTGQNVALVDRTRDRFSSPNIHIRINQRLVQRVVNRTVNQCEPVRDCILGTRIIGDAFLTGNVTATLLPSTGSVRLQVALNGTLTTNSIGYNGPVRLRTTGVGQVHATRQIQIDNSGVNMEPVAASASLATRINAIEHPLRLVRRIARKKAGQQKPKADRIAHGRLKSRIAESFTKETDGATAKLDTDLMAEARAYLQRLDIDQPERTMGSTSEFVLVSATIRKDNQLAAPMPPTMVPVMNEATLQIHESVINNTIGSILAGRTMNRKELQSLASKTGRVAENQPAKSDADEKELEFEIDFDPSRPIIFEARDGSLRIGIRGTRFSQGSRQLKQQLEIVATYRPIQTKTGQILLKRIGETKINFPGTKRLSISQTGLRSSIKKAFADAFPQTLMDQPWTVPTTVDIPALQGRTFQPKHFDAQNGWLTLGVSS